MMFRIAAAIVVMTSCSAMTLHAESDCNLPMCCNHPVNKNGTIKPVFYMHGLNAPAKIASGLLSQLKENNARWACSIPLFEDTASFVSLETQIPAVWEFIKKKHAEYFPDEKYQLVCHSQGGLICRGIMQLYEHEIHRAVLIAAPLQGVYGPVKEVAKFFGDSIGTRNWIIGHAWRILSSSTLLNLVNSISNLWHDPKHEDVWINNNVPIAYLDGHKTLGESIGRWLPFNVYDSEGARNERVQKYKENFHSIHEIVLLASPTDEEVLPWYSAHFDFHRPGTSFQDNARQRFYDRPVNDILGLEELVNTKKLKMEERQGIRHNDWLGHSKFRTEILPYLKKD